LNPLISTADLAARLGDPKLVVLDASWHMPGVPRDPAKEFAERHIPGAVFFDIDGIADHSTDLPHMLPSPAEFATAARRLGVEPDSEIVVYDSEGIRSAPRVWWTFRVMGHDAVRVLDGGLKAWLAEGRPVETGWPEPPPHGEFKAHFRPALVRDVAAMRANVDSRAEQVVDARSGERFRAEAPEPRAGLRGGHIPGSRNTPFTELVAADGTLKPPEAIRAAFEAAELDLEKPIVASCGSGLTAAVLALGLARIGRDDVAVYDGSWTEWGGLPDTPVAVGPAS
jgi:thiosulfate/3-mercaptopyruvate sulfurtransferase